MTGGSRHGLGGGVFFRSRNIRACLFSRASSLAPPIVPGQLGGVVGAVAPQPDTSGSRTVGSPTTRLPPWLLGKFPPGSIQVPGPPTCRAIQNMSPPGRGRCCCGASASPDLFMAPRGRWRGRGKDREKDHRDESRESRSRDVMMVEPSSTITTVLAADVSRERMHQRRALVTTARASPLSCSLAVISCPNRADRQLARSQSP